MLEEPEHLGWYPFTPRRKAIAAEHVVVVVMTNYAYYITHSGLPFAATCAGPVDRLRGHLIRTRTDVMVPISTMSPVADPRHPMRKIRITGALPEFYGVPPVRPDQRGVYFMGRLVWFNGLRTLIETAARMNQPMDVFGEGPDRGEMERLVDDTGAPVRFLGSTARPWAHPGDYRVFFNPSLSEVMCTTNIEALAAGRNLVLPRCPANEPFLSLPNVHAYHDGDVDGLTEALSGAAVTPPESPEPVRRESGWPEGCRRLAALWEEAGAIA